jgi:hypothetical protein
MGFIIGYSLGQMGAGGGGLAAIYEYCQSHPGECELSKGDYFAFGIFSGVFIVLIAFLIGAAIMFFRESRDMPGGIGGGKSASVSVPLPPDFLNRKR